MELKTILAIVLCLVIVGGAIFLHMRKNVSKRLVPGGLLSSLAYDIAQRQ